MLNGTWDWQNFGVILDYLQTWFDNGYLYEDCGTIKQADVLNVVLKMNVHLLLVLEHLSRQLL